MGHVADLECPKLACPAMVDHKAHIWNSARGPDRLREPTWVRCQGRTHADNRRVREAKKSEAFAVFERLVKHRIPATHAMVCRNPDLWDAVVEALERAYSNGADAAMIYAESVVSRMGAGNE